MTAREWELDAWRTPLHDAFVRPIDHAVARSHIEAMFDAADTWPQRIVSTRVRPPRRTVRCVLVSATGAALVVGGSVGMAAAEVLPGPAQHAMATVASHLGLEIADPRPPVTASSPARGAVPNPASRAMRRRTRYATSTVVGAPIAPSAPVVRTAPTTAASIPGATRPATTTTSSLPTTTTISVATTTTTLETHRGPKGPGAGDSTTTTVVPAEPTTTTAPPRGTEPTTTTVAVAAARR